MLNKKERGSEKIWEVDAIKSITLLDENGFVWNKSMNNHHYSLWVGDLWFRVEIIKNISFGYSMGVYANPRERALWACNDGNCGTFKDATYQEFEANFKKLMNFKSKI